MKLLETQLPDYSKEFLALNGLEKVQLTLEAMGSLRSLITTLIQRIEEMMLSTLPKF